MTTNKTTPKELWARQQISGPDVDYDLWNKKRISVQAFSQMSQNCIFTVDVFKERYDFASDSFAHLFRIQSHLDKDNQATRRFTGRENTP